MKKKINQYNSEKWKDLIKGKKLSEKNWFQRNIFFLDKYLSDLKSKNNKILEIGSFEGISAIYFIKNFKNSFLTCVDLLPEVMSINILEINPSLSKILTLI